MGSLWVFNKRIMNVCSITVCQLISKVMAKQVPVKFLKIRREISKLICADEATK